MTAAAAAVATMLRYWETGTHIAAKSFFSINGSMGRTKKKTECGEILLVQQHFYYFEHENFIIEGRFFFRKINSLVSNSFCWMLLYFCHSFGQTNLFIFHSRSHCTVACILCARYSLIGIKFEMLNIK